MKVIKVVSPVLLAFAICFAMMPMTMQAHAASKKSVYVVSKISTVFHSNVVKGNTETSKPGYNKNGLLTKFTRRGESTQLSYDKNNNLKKAVYHETDMTGTAKYTWSNGKLVKSDYTSIDKSLNSTSTYTYTGKNITSSSGSAKYYGEEYAYTYTYAYNKDGHIKQLVYKDDEITDTDTCTFDKKGNVVTQKMSSSNKGEKGSVKAKITYKKGRVYKIKETIKNPERGTITASTTFKYKKIKVKKSLAKRIQNQQWQLINYDAASIIW